MTGGAGQPGGGTEGTAGSTAGGGGQTGGGASGMTGTQGSTIKRRIPLEDSFSNGILLLVDDRNSCKIDRTIDEKIRLLDIGSDPEGLKVLVIT